MNHSGIGIAIHDDCLKALLCSDRLGPSPDSLSSVQRGGLLDSYSNG